jgi:hypothetical protein
VATLRTLAGPRAGGLRAANGQYRVLSVPAAGIAGRWGWWRWVLGERRVAAKATASHDAEARYLKRSLLWSARGARTRFGPLHGSSKADGLRPHGFERVF